MGTGTSSSEDRIKSSLVAEFDAGFAELVNAYQPGIYSGAMRLTGTREDAQDVAQDTFLRAYTALEAYGDDRIEALHIRAWLWTIAINLCRTRAKRRRPSVPFVDGHDTVALDPDPMDDAAWSERLSRLPDNQRIAVILRHVLDLPISEISEVVERPEGTVKADISRGLARLRSIMDSEVRR
jgi:RNA polymerase sigma-70 factor (ECF subfamily)